jgi:hypothetical protein
MEMGEDSWEHHVTPLLMNCGQEDNNVGGGHEEYLQHAEEVRAASLKTRDVCAHGPSMLHLYRFERLSVVYRSCNTTLEKTFQFLTSDRCV